MLPSINLDPKQEEDLIIRVEVKRWWVIQKVNRYLVGVRVMLKGESQDCSCQKRKVIWIKLRMTINQNRKKDQDPQNEKI